ncbi:HD-GYP domain-containing protein [Bacillus sp. CGMCC 1.16607]|uniref:HD-GYP domain-containing protein n=1 Tax=Bacillus sp. CGMCC 1.16607 TaxID=3351842 RepID=UPI003642E230
MTIYKKKYINELLQGDIILHPLYRTDGLLFLTRYKELTSSILITLKKQFPSNIQILIVSSINDLETFEVQKIYQNEKFIKELESIANLLSIYIKTELDILNYKDERAFISNLHITSIFDKFIHSPIWRNLERFFDSTYLLKRVPKVKELFFQTLKKDPLLEILFKQLREFHDVLKIHSMNTVIISISIGLTLELNDEELVELAIATLFADIGFIKYPKSDFVVYLNHGKRHDLLANHIKQSIEAISTSQFCKRKNVVFGILDHHERVDGTGSPKNKKGNEIHLFGKIIAISQKYDELVGGYIEETSLVSYQAMQYIWEHRGTMLDEEIIRIFIYRTSIFKINEPFFLPNYQKGIIIGFSDFINSPLLPIVKMEEGYIRDLSKTI